MDDNSSINVVARNLQRAAKKIRGGGRRPTRSVSGHHSKAKSKSMKPSRKYVFKEKKFRGGFEGGKDKEELEESNLFSSSEGEENRREENRGKVSVSPVREKNFILRNKQMVEKRRKKGEERERSNMKSRKKYAHVKAKVQNKLPRSKSKVSKRSKSINMRPEGHLGEERLRGKVRVSPKYEHFGERREEGKTRSKSRKWKGFGKRKKESVEERERIPKRDLRQMEEEYEREMQKFKTKRVPKKDFESRLKQRLKSNYADHNTRPRKWASPVP